MPHDPKVIPIMRGRLVLVAERHGTPRVLVTSAVRNLGYPAKACSTAADALAFLALHPDGVQCLLADVGLPDMDGRELAARALAIVPGLRVVLMVAPGDDAVQRPIPSFGGLPVRGQAGVPRSTRRHARGTDRPTGEGAEPPAVHGPAAGATSPLRQSPGLKRADPPRRHAAAGRADRAGASRPALR